MVEKEIEQFVIKNNKEKVYPVGVVAEYMKNIRHSIFINVKEEDIND